MDDIDAVAPLTTTCDFAITLPVVLPVIFCVPVCVPLFPNTKVGPFAVTVPFTTNELGPPVPLLPVAPPPTNSVPLPTILNVIEAKPLKLAAGNVMEPAVWLLPEFNVPSEAV